MNFTVQNWRGIKASRVIGISALLCGLLGQSHAQPSFSELFPYERPAPVRPPVVHAEPIEALPAVVHPEPAGTAPALVPVPTGSEIASPLPPPVAVATSPAVVSTPEVDTEVAPPASVPLPTGAYDPIRVNIAQVDTRRGLAEVVNLTDSAISLAGWSIEVNGDLRPLGDGKTIAPGAVLPVSLKGHGSNLQLTLRSAAGAIVQQIEAWDGKVNRAPKPFGETKWFVREGDEFTTKLKVKDGDHNWLQYEIVRGPRGLIVDLSGTIHWQPSEAAGPGKETIEIAVNDGESPMGRIVFRREIEVAEVNEKPTLQTVGDQIATGGQQWSLQMTARDSDLPRQTLSWLLVDGPDEMTLNNGVLSWTPASVKQDVLVPVAVQVSDDVGGIALNGFTVLVRGTESEHPGPEVASPSPTLADIAPEPVESAPEVAEEKTVDAAPPTLVVTEVIKPGTIVVTEVIESNIVVPQSFEAGFLGGVAVEVYPVASTIGGVADVFPVALAEPISTGIVHGEIISGGTITSETIGIAPWEAVAIPAAVIRFP